MGKAKRAEKKARREVRGTAQEAALEAAEHATARRRKLWRTGLYALPVLVAAAAAVLYFLLAQPQLAGIVLLAGAVVWFPLWLGTIGSEVQPRDRRRAGGIDFGQR